MKTRSFLKVILNSFFTVCFISCNKYGEELVPVTSETTFNVTFKYAYKGTDTNSGQVLFDVDYCVGDMDILIFIAFKDIQIPLGFDDIHGTWSWDVVSTFFEPLSRNYEEAATQIPNGYVHYATAEFEVSATDGANKPMLMVLKKMTTDLIFEFADADKVPDSGDYSLIVGVENIPSAFFIATGKTLTKKEAQERELYLYSGERTIMVPATDGRSAVVTTFHTLSNDNIPTADRGKYWFEFKENFNGGKQLNATSENLSGFSPDYSSSMYIYGLYDKEQPAISTKKKKVY